MIKVPPINVFHSGISFKNKNAIIIPNIGCVLPIILAVLTLKYLKLFINIVWPIAVVSSAKIITYGNWDTIADVSIKNNTGAKTTVSMAT